MSGSTAAQTQPQPARASDDAGEDDLTVRAERPRTAASDTHVGDRELRSRPGLRTADLLEVAPGLVILQHAGGGKAQQYFLRGFDADHGSDIALSVDGVPINHPTHAHGQGYADMNFVLPELVERVDVQEGPYHTLSGDFATAGSIDLRLRRTLPHDFVAFDGGLYGRARLVGGVRARGGPARGYLAGEVAHEDGPFVRAQDFNRLSLVGRFGFALSRAVDLTLSVMSYTAGWNASGLVPSREVLAGRLSPFGSIGGPEGANTARYSFTAELHARPAPGHETRVLGYVVRDRLDLFSNFTLFRDDRARGDMLAQFDARTTAGVRASHQVRHRAGGWNFATLVGAQARFDDIDNSLHLAPDRERTDAVRSFFVRLALVGALVEETIEPLRWLRLIVGVRADAFVADVVDRRTPGDSHGPGRTGGRVDGIVSPKGTLVLSPWRPLDVFANVGSGFHSNDARGTILARDAVTPLARAIGYEFGARLRVGSGFQAAIALWRMDLASEIVWAGDGGGTQARGATRRMGLTATLRADVAAWLRADLDMTFTDAAYVDAPASANAIALAPPFTLSAGISARHPNGLFAAVRVRAMASRAATEDRALTAEGFAIVSAQVGYRHRVFEASVQAENLLNSPWREAQFAIASQLRTESAPVTDLHFTPGTPMAITSRLAAYLP